MRVVGSVEKWPRAFPNADIAIIPRTEGGTTTLGQKTLSDLPRRRASVNLGQVEEKFWGCFPEFVSRVGTEASSVDAWYLIEETLLVFGADVIKSCAAVQTESWTVDCAHGTFGLQGSFRRVCLLLTIRRSA